MAAWLAPLIGAGLGLAGANQKSNAQDRATEAQMAGFKQYEPYVDANLSGANTALNGVLNQGAYGGQTYAGANDFQTGTANTMGGYGTSMQNSGFGMMDQNAGFGNNYQNMYGQAQGLYGQSQDIYGKSQGLYGQAQDVYNQGASLSGQNQDLFQQNKGLYNQFQGLSEEAKADRLGTAMDYANTNSGDLVNSAMRDDRRNLQENTLPGIDLAASGTNNMNSSRAGIAEAVANRAYDDRRADVSMGIQDRLIDRSLNNQAQQFADRSNALTNAGTAGAAQGSNLAGAGNALSNQNNSLSAASGALGSSSNFLAGGGNHLNTAGNMNQGISGAYTQGLNTLGQGANFGMNAGNSLQGYNQAGLNDAQANFERQRDFELNQRKGFQSGMLNQAPNTVGNVAANQVSGINGAMSGAMQGFGFANQYGDQLFGGGRAPNAYTGNQFGNVRPNLSGR